MAAEGDGKAGEGAEIVAQASKLREGGDVADTLLRPMQPVSALNFSLQTFLEHFGTKSIGQKITSQPLDDG